VSICSPLSVSSLHEYPILATLIVIGVICAVGIVITYLFRVMGDVVDSYYDFRVKRAQARERFRQSMKERAKDTG
jgi:hypothetical protein